MNDQRVEESAARELERLERRIDELATLCERLKEENRLLRAQQETLNAERAGLIDKHELVRTRVEAMVGRLKSMEQST